jgi:hypothetical protein
LRRIMALSGGNNEVQRVSQGVAHTVDFG